MKSLLVNILYASICLTLIGCAVTASGPEFKKTKINDPSKSIIYVYRIDSGRSFGFDSRIAISIDGKEIGRVGLGGHVYAIVPNGEHEIIARTLGVYATVAQAVVKIKEGKSVYLKVTYAVPVVLENPPQVDALKEISITNNEGSAVLSKTRGAIN